jgi:predicted amidohydrolase YtcJ
MLTAAVALFALPVLPAQPADLVVENAQIWSDGLPGLARFMAIRGGEVVHVGEAREDLIGPQTRRLDVGGAVVLPGLIDSHVHMLNGGLNLSQLQLREASDKADFIERVRRWAVDLPEGRWVLGGRWSVESWQVREQPTKEWVDPVTGSRPLYLPRMDGHSALANSAALKIAGISKDGPPDPPGGVIDRDARGEPTGILRETAMALVSRHVPPTSSAEKLEALRKAIAHANAHGITAVSDIVAPLDLPIYNQLEPNAPMRFSLYPTASDWAQGASLREMFRDNERVQVRGFKAYLDGSLGSRTAFMREPFLGNPAERPDWRGLPMPILQDGSFLRNARAAGAAGLQTIAHAIGDEANRLLLDNVALAYGDLRGARARSEHAQHLLPEDVARFGVLGVIASMQPYHKADDGRYAESYIGEARSRSSYAFKSLLDAGAVVAFGSDWPVVSINPFLGIEAAVTGKTLDGKFWQTQENITVAEALRGYTSRGAYAMFMERRIGRLAPGFRADFIVLNESVFGDNVRWERIRPARVFVDGEEVALAPTEQSQNAAYTATTACAGCRG